MHSFIPTVTMTMAAAAVAAAVAGTTTRAAAPDVDRTAQVARGAYLLASPGATTATRRG